jgi:deuterolysin
MKFSASIATLVSLAAAAPGAVPVNSNGVDVKLELQDNSKVKAVLTNSGKDNIKVLKTGSILDDTPVKKASVSGSSK